MKILIVSRSFYPMISPRAFRAMELVKEFARQGHDVTLLTSKVNEHHVPFEKEHGVTIEDWGELKFSEIDTSAKNPVVRIIKHVVRRVLNLFLEYPDIQLMPKVKHTLATKNGFDLLISIAVPHPIHWGVAWARSNQHRIADTWVADCGDPYMGADMDTFKKMFYFKYFEKAFCRRADTITVPLEGAIEAYYPEFRDKIEVIPQGFNFDEVNIDWEAYQPNEITTFAYAGGFIPGMRDPRKFLDYLTDLDRPWKFILYSRDRDIVEPYIKKAGGKIEIRDYIPRHELLQKLAGMDFLVNFENSSSMMMPSKLIDYHLAGRPVLSVNGNEVDKTVVDQFLEGDYSKAYNYENIGRFRIENVCRKFLQLCDGS